jgi:hypothetical protein
MNTLTALSVHQPDRFAPGVWRVSGDLREIFDLPNESTNHVVADRLRRIPMFDKASIDPEYSMFIAYTDSESTARFVAEAAEREANDIADENARPDFSDEDKSTPPQYFLVEVTGETPIHQPTVAGMQALLERHGGPGFKFRTADITDLADTQTIGSPDRLGINRLQ